MSKEENRKELFFPYYINQGRLMDIYAILNNGYSEYEELTFENSIERAKDAKGNLSATGGFKLFKISGEASIDTSKITGNTNGTTVKKVQTISSVLSLVIKELKEKRYIKDVKNAKAGSFICLPVNLKINSIKNMIDELIDMMKLISDISKTGVSTGIKQSDLKIYENIAKSLKSLINSEEIVSECDDYAVTGNISESNYYQGNKSDIIDTDIMCLAQVKKVFPNGTELMKNNKMGLFKDESVKQSLISGIKEMNQNDDFNFSSTAITEIKNKPVYQIEIIALYQSEEFTD